MENLNLPPLVRSITVSWDQATAFKRFTSEFGRWWPAHTHSVGGKCVREVVFEAKPGGLIFERHSDGRRFQWGQISVWEPPQRVSFSWHPSREPETAQEVEIRFEPQSNGTKVTLTSSRWERWGENAAKARSGYDIGWGHILKIWAGQRSLGTTAQNGLMALMGLIQKFRGGQKQVIAKSKGEIPAG